MARIDIESSLGQIQQISSIVRKVTNGQVLSHFGLLNIQTDQVLGKLHETRSGAAGEKSRLIRKSLKLTRYHTKGVGKGVTKGQAEENADYYRANTLVVYYSDRAHYYSRDNRVGYIHTENDGLPKFKKERR